LRSWRGIRSGLSIQNDCSIREKRVRKDLYSLILEAARRTDEKTPLPSAADPVSGSEPPLPDPVAESLLGIRAESRMNWVPAAAWKMPFRIPCGMSV